MSVISEKIIKKAEEKFYAFFSEHRKEIGRNRGLVIQIQEKDARMSMNTIVLGSFCKRTDITDVHDTRVTCKAIAKATSLVAELMCSNRCTTYTTESKEGGGIATAFYYASAVGFPSDLAHLFLFQVLRECEMLAGREGEILLEFEQYCNKKNRIKT